MKINAIRLYQRPQNSSFKNITSNKESYKNNSAFPQTTNEVSFGGGKTKSFLFGTLALFATLFSSCTSRHADKLERMPITLGKGLNIETLADSIEVNGKMYYPAKYASGIDPKNKIIYKEAHPFGDSYTLHTFEPFLDKKTNASLPEDITRYKNGDISKNEFVNADFFRRKEQCEKGDAIVYKQSFDLSYAMKNDANLAKYIKEIARKAVDNYDSSNLMKGIRVDKPRFNPPRSNIKEYSVFIDGKEYHYGN